MKLKQKVIGKIIHIQEPELNFGFNQTAIDPRDGITFFGPYDRSKHVGQIKVGIIGPLLQRDMMVKYLRALHAPVNGVEEDIARPYFPGLEAAFGISINFESLQQIDVSVAEISEFLRYTDKHQRVHNLVNLYSNQLIQHHNREEIHPQVWFVVIPEAIYLHGRPKSSFDKSGGKINIGLSKKDREKGVLFLFESQNELKAAYEYEVNFHNQLKAKLLEHKIITQIIRDRKIAYKELWDNDKRIKEEEKLDSAKAWNISNALYYKSGGLPWKLSAVRERVCYLGLVYKKMDADSKSLNACCAAQMFLDSGDGMVFRGNIGPWFNPQTGEFHLLAKDAKELIQKSLDSFVTKSNENHYPEEIFIHSRTYFNDEEWAAFEQVAKGKSKLIGVRIRGDSNFKLYRIGTYAVPRGTALILNKRKAYLWTRGYIPRLQTQTGLETPNPIFIEVTRGVADIEQVCKDILALTKLNYNSCIYGDGLPVTLRFADSIGEILTAGPMKKSEVLPFKNYI